MQNPLRFSGIHELEPQQLNALFQVEVMRSSCCFDLFLELCQPVLQQFHAAVVLPGQFGNSHHVFSVSSLFLDAAW